MGEGIVQTVASRRKIVTSNLRISMGTLNPWSRLLTLALYDTKARAQGNHLLASGVGEIGTILGVLV